MATAGPSMNKIIHRAIRRDLGRFRRALEEFTDGDRQRAADLHRAWVSFDAQLTEHHEGEHEVAWPMLRALGFTPATIDSLEGEHGAMAADLAATGSAMDRLRASAAREDAAAAGKAMAQLEATTLTHLDHEEREIEATISGSADHPAVKEANAKFRRRAGLGETGAFLAWIQDGASAQERADLHAHVPRPVVGVIGGVLGRRYRREIAPVWDG